MQNNSLIVNDVTGLNPVAVWAISKPRSVEEVVEAVRRTDGAISVGGGHFSMGGQTASPNTLHLDLRELKKVVAFYPAEKIIRVQAGIRWCDIQRFVDPHDLAVKIMQTYANFTVGGALSVNCHGRYMGRRQYRRRVSRIQRRAFLRRHWRLQRRRGDCGGGAKPR
jgi:FAD/FMN-containing dehydrogenase